MGIGTMTFECTDCGAEKIKRETPSMCCSGSKVKLPPLPHPPEPLQTIITSTSLDNKNIHKHLRSSFAMISLGAKEVQIPGWNPSIRTTTEFITALVSSNLLRNIKSNTSSLTTYWIPFISNGVKAPPVKVYSIDRKFIKILFFIHMPEL